VFLDAPKQQKVRHLSCNRKIKDEAGAHGRQRLSHGRRRFPIMYRNFFVRSFVPV
jgi:hypothetical protein